MAPKTETHHHHVQGHWVSTLLGRFHTAKQQLDLPMLMESIHSQWNLHERLHISLIARNLFILRFKQLQDKQRILDGQPLEIQNHLLILKELHNFEDPRYVELSHVPIWFHFHGLFLEHYYQTSIASIAKAVGTVLCIEPEQGLPTMEKGFRARVNVNISLPLQPGTLVRTHRNGLSWVSILPERLPSAFCKKCLLLGHQDFEHDEIAVSVPPPLQEMPNFSQLGPYQSFYSAPDPRMVVSCVCDRLRGVKKEQNTPTVDYLQGRSPRLQVFTQKMVKQLFDFIVSSQGRSFLQRLGLVLVPTEEGDSNLVVEDQFGVQQSVLSPQILRLISAAQFDILENTEVNVQDGNVEVTIKQENEEVEPSEPWGYGGRSLDGESGGIS